MKHKENTMNNNENTITTQGTSLYRWIFQSFTDHLRLRKAEIDVIARRCPKPWSERKARRVMAGINHIIYIVTDIYLEHHFSKISEPFLRTSKQLHLEHQKCSKYALRTSEKQILRTSPLIFGILRTLNTHILRTCPVTLVNLHIYTQIPW